MSPVVRPGLSHALLFVSTQALVHPLANICTLALDLANALFLLYVCVFVHVSDIVMGAHMPPAGSTCPPPGIGL